MKFQYSPRSSREFGRLLKVLTILNLPVDQSLSGTARHLANLLEIDLSMVSAWFRGDLHGNKPLSVENFRKIIFLFLGKPCGLQSKEDVLEFAQLAGEDYALDLQRQSFLDKLVIQAVSSISQPNTKQLHVTPAFELQRTDLLRKINQLARRCQSLGSPLVLLGPPGIGKTILIHQLERDKELRRMFPDQVLTTDLKAGSYHSALRAWLEDIGLGVSPWHDKEALLASSLRKYLRDQKALLLIDNVSDPASAQALLLANRRRSLTVLTTSRAQIARKLAANAECILPISGFTSEDALLLYNRVWGEVSAEIDGHIKTITDLTWGHPMALHAAFHLGKQLGWEALLEMLKSAKGVPFSFAGEIYLPLKLAYEQLPPDVQTCFRRGFDLPRCPAHDMDNFADQWEQFPAQILYYLDTLMTDAGMVRHTPTSDGQWEVHPQLNTFVRSLLSNS